MTAGFCIEIFGDGRIFYRNPSFCSATAGKLKENALFAQKCRRRPAFLRKMTGDGRFLYRNVRRRPTFLYKLKENPLFPSHFVRLVRKIHSLPHICDGHRSESPGFWARLGCIRHNSHKLLVNTTLSCSTTGKCLLLDLIVRPNLMEEIVVWLEMVLFVLQI